MIQAYNHKPTAVMYSTPNERITGRTPYYGLEIEVDQMNTNATRIEAEYSNTFTNEFTYQKGDGSLRNGGFEIVTHPATLAYHLSNDGANWDARCKQLNTAGAKSHDTQTCGLHIHVSKKSMKPQEQILFGLFINRHKSQMEAIARRKDGENGNIRFFAYINLPELTEMYYASDLIATYKNYISNKRRAQSRYRAVNYKNKSTIEVRIFKGTLKASTIKASVELIDAIVKYIKGNSVTNIMQADKDAAWTTFCNFVVSNNYPTLVEYMKKRRVMAATIEAATQTASAIPTAARRRRTSIANDTELVAYVRNIFETTPDRSILSIRNEVRARFNTNTGHTTIYRIRESM